MLFDIQKFNKEIKALRALSKSRDLDNLRSRQIKANVISAIANETPFYPQRSSSSERGEKFMKYVISILIGLGLIGGTALASEQSLPGSIFYPVKTFKEKIEVNVAVSAEAKARAESRHAEQRLKELAKLHAGADAELRASKINTEIKTQTALKAEVEANARAEFQVRKAIQALNVARVKLEAKGNTTAAVKIGENIVKLRQQAESQGFEVKLENNSEGKFEVEVKRPATIEGRGELKSEVKGEIKLEFEEGESAARGIRVELKGNVGN